MTIFFRYIFAIFFILIQLFQISAQSVEEIKSNRQKYIWGEGVGNTLMNADNEAMMMLVSQISTQVESSFSHLVEESKNNKKIDFKETFSAVINSYSSATLRNTERIVIENEPDAKVFRYIKREEVNKIFVERKQKILDFISSAQKHEERLEIAFALKYYYWALSLLRSHPEANNLRYNVENEKSELLLIYWIPKKLNEIFTNIDAQVVNVDKQDISTLVLLNFSYKNKLVKNFDYSYWTGNDWTPIHSAKNGQGLIEFFGFQSDEIKLKAEYLFLNEARSDQELSDVLNKLDVIPYRASYYTIKTNNINKENQVAQQKMQTENSLDLEALKINLVNSPDEYLNSVEKLTKSLRNNDDEQVQKLMTKDALEVYNKLLKYGNAKVLSNKDLNFVEYERGVIARSIPMSFNFENNNRTFVEDVVLYFDKEGKIENITFGLEKAAVDDILKRDVWQESVRLNIISFLENYKTAYALKRLDYIESVFADDALIIVGSVLKKQTAPDQLIQNNKIVKYNRYTKDQFIRNLGHSFRSKEFINIKFEDNIVRKSGKGGEVYGIQIKQNYFSSNYGDAGYLFLMVDINDPTKPIIKVRTWQPDKNPDGSIYGLENF